VSSSAEKVGGWRDGERPDFGAPGDECVDHVCAGGQRALRRTTGDGTFGDGDDEDSSV
jgi:hypothetical protein